MFVVNSRSSRTARRSRFLRALALATVASLAFAGVAAAEDEAAEKQSFPELDEPDGSVYVGGTRRVDPGLAGSDNGSTLIRALTNTIFGPVDIALSPVVAGVSIYQNLKDVDDSLAVKIAYPVPGYFWVTGVQLGAGGLRTVTGLVLELVPGAILAFIPNAEMDPMFDPVDRGSALVDWDNDNFPVKFGINYTTPAF